MIKENDIVLGSEQWLNRKCIFVPEEASSPGQMNLVFLDGTAEFPSCRVIRAFLQSMI